MAFWHDKVLLAVPFHAILPWNLNCRFKSCIWILDICLLLAKYCELIFLKCTSNLLVSESDDTYVFKLQNIFLRKCWSVHFASFLKHQKSNVSVYVHKVRNFPCSPTLFHRAINKVYIFRNYFMKEWKYIWLTNYNLIIWSCSNT